MGGKQDGFPFAVHPLEKGHHLMPGRRIQTTEGLIQDQNFRIREEREQKRDLLDIPFGKFAQRNAEVRLELEMFCKDACAFPGVRTGKAINSGGVLHQFQRRKSFKKIGVLGKKGEGLPRPGISWGASLEHHLSLRGKREPQKKPEGGAFSGTVMSDKPKKFSPSQREGKILKRMNSAAPEAIPFLHVLENHHGIHRRDCTTLMLNGPKTTRGDGKCVVPCTPRILYPVNQENAERNGTGCPCGKPVNRTQSPGEPDCRGVE